ncbi:hypothetical protein OOK13_16505 [Streptomyces sp. NBC_00378]|uniref:hypothetical protein n=1 Tax=unclassified Streptomyces TaxID=2593676 RepID=UPI002250FA7D|nr:MULTISPECIES: hypothetical protein [unclassified Streptomyces]MCX5110115.1 hypothetical protein [Streptomyces sp. NBC_00378]
MRRVLTAFGTLAAAAMLSVSVTQSASAAQGDLVVNGTVYSDPTGCYPSDRWPLSVENYTNDLAVIFQGADCSGPILGVVAPGGSEVSEFGGSVFIR